MKLSELASKLGINDYELEHFLSEHEEIKIGGGLFQAKIDDNDVDKIVNLFEQKKVVEAQIKEEQVRKEQEKQRKEQEKQRAAANMLITSGFNFDGYTITKYSGYISGDDAVQIPRAGWFGADNTAQQLTDALVKIRIQAMKELKEAAYDLGCNAIVGVDFDYITMEPETANGTGGTTYQPYVICVTANGNAVVIEKN